MHLVLSADVTVFTFWSLAMGHFTSSAPRQVSSWQTHPNEFVQVARHLGVANTFHELESPLDSSFVHAWCELLWMDPQSEG